MMLSKHAVRVDGQRVFNNLALRLSAVLAGFGLAYELSPNLGDGRAGQAAAVVG